MSKKIQAESKFGVDDLVIFRFSFEDEEYSTYGPEVVSNTDGSCFAAGYVKNIRYDSEQNLFTYDVTLLNGDPHSEGIGLFKGIDEKFLFPVWEFLESMSSKILNFQLDQDVEQD